MWLVGNLWANLPKLAPHQAAHAQELVVLVQSMMWCGACFVLSFPGVGHLGQRHHCGCLTPLPSSWLPSTSLVVGRGAGVCLAGPQQQSLCGQCKAQLCGHMGSPRAHQASQLYSTWGQCPRLLCSVPPPHAASHNGIWDSCFVNSCGSHSFGSCRNKHASM